MRPWAPALTVRTAFPRPHCGFSGTRLRPKSEGRGSGTARSTPRGVSLQNLHPNVPEKWGDRW